MGPPPRAAKEKAARTTCHKLFTKAVKRLRDRIADNLSSSEVEIAEKKLCEYFDKLEEAHKAYVIAKQSYKAPLPRNTFTRLITEG